MDLIQAIKVIFTKKSVVEIVYHRLVCFFFNFSLQLVKLHRYIAYLLD